MSDHSSRIYLSAIVMQLGFLLIAVMEFAFQEQESTSSSLDGILLLIGLGSGIAGGIMMVRYILAALSSGAEQT
jgi:hypothetical protein